MQTIQERAILLAEELQLKIEQNISQQEKNFHHKMKLLLNNPKNKALLVELLDRSFRSKSNATKFDIISHTLNKYGKLDFFSPFERFLLYCFLNFGGLAKNISVPFFIQNIRKDTKNMVLDLDTLKEHTKKRENEGITLNVNIIGEEVLGEEEARLRLKHYEEAIKSDYINYISIKITTIFSQINILDFDYCKKEIISRLDSLYALALKQEQEQKKQKFINLDMEEFRDLELTIASFKESISKFDLEAGIVLQAYLPDSYHCLKDLIEFSKKRVQSGKKPIKVRIVKGANMEAEETIASQRDWEMPTFSTKVQTDSNYKKMLHLVLENDNFKYIKIGIASHNLFEIAYAYTLINDKNAANSFSFEMLEGMSMQASHELSKLHKLILYAPVCDISHFNNAIAYLVRRLDENTAESNFMRHFFDLKINSNAWDSLKKLFLDSIKTIESLDNSTKRLQNRNNKITTTSTLESSFKNEADTDFILKANRKWAENIREKFANLTIEEIYAKATKNLESSEVIKIHERIKNRHIANIHIANEAGIKQALEIAQNSTFSELSSMQIHKLLSKVAQNFRDKRGDLLGIAALEVGKTFAEIDAEVSEAIDFLEFYPYSLKILKEQNPNTSFKPRGIGVVIAPWNFPIGISVGSITAALSGGNRVIYKPSSISAICGAYICNLFWEAGIPQDALIYLPSRGSDISRYLLRDSSVAFCILTGGEETAYKMLEANPTLLLSAETGGKNATIVTKNADRDQAIKNIIHSAFSNSGQKCSATSLLILEDEVYNDENFKNTLRDAANSMNMGNPFDFKNKMGTLANKIDSKLKKALEEKEPNTEWLLPPKFSKDESGEINEFLMYPCIKYGVKESDYTYKTELFAPFLSVMKADSLEHAINLANSTGYGLTGALESLDEREWEIFAKNIEVGNAYINKPTTGAIVLRQPFGGIKKSAIGFGRKVGIFNYVSQFMQISQDKIDNNLANNELSNKLESFASTLDFKLKPNIESNIYMAKSYLHAFNSEFSQTKEYIKVRGEDNLFSYTKIKNLLFVVSLNDSLDSIIGVMIGCYISNVSLEISIDNELFKKYSNILENSLFKDIFRALDYKITLEDINKAIEKVPNFERIRYHATPSINDSLYIAASKEAKIIIREKPILNGRFELLYYFNEKSISISYHRYGNLGMRAYKE